MMPKSAVAERATMTRLWARLPFRSLISISVLRHHGGLRRNHNPVARDVADYRDPGLKAKRDLDRDRAAAGRADARAVPDETGVGRYRRGRAVRRYRLAGAGVRRQREAAAQLALHGADYLQAGRER